MGFVWGSGLRDAATSNHMYKHFVIVIWLFGILLTRACFVFGADRLHVQYIIRF